MNCFAGIDIGSTAIKVALIDDAEQVLASFLYPTGSQFKRNAEEALTRALEKAGVGSDNLAFSVSTGYGRRIFKNSDHTISEISANAAGASHPDFGAEGVRTVINIGGQDTKIIRLDDMGCVSNFRMNDKCAAGTGRFLDMAAHTLEVDVEELAGLHERAQGDVLAINSTCTVYAESEVISLLADGHQAPEIAAGIHHSIAKRIVNLTRSTGIEETILFDGGPALNAGMVDALEISFSRKIHVAALPQFTTALGAALIAKEEWLEEEA